MYKLVKLTKKTAAQLINQICPRLTINKDATAPDVAIFRADYSVYQFEIRFQFEEERLVAGLPITTREFHQALKNKIQIKESEQK